MTQIFTGTGLGSHGSSLSQLGSYGPKGAAGLGQGGGSMYVNAANGNLVLKQSDGFLANSGAGLDLFQTYNSRDAKAWRFNTDTRLAFEGHANTAGSCVKRTDEDGHQSRFSYDTQQKAYLADDGSTAKLTFDGTNWSYREGASQTTCHYNTDGQLTDLIDRDGHVLRFNYTNGQLTTITDNSNKQTITWSFSQGLLHDVTFQSDGQTVHHVHYDYDAQNRLNRISRDLGEGKTYWTAYDYAGDTNLISGIRQSDGTNLHLDYDAEGRIKRLIDGEGRITSYDYQAGKTIVTNGLGESWAYYYDTDARLTGIDGPENFHIRYHYDGKHLDAITQGNQRWQFNYNDAGDCVRLESPSGEVILRSYDNAHRLLSETRYQAFDDKHRPIKPQTARFIYDSQGHLRFEMTPDGVVTEHRYDENGCRISSRCFLQGRWQEPTSTLDELISWSQSHHQISLVEYHYDWRGCLTEEIHYTQTNEQGAGIATADTIRTYSRFDAAGRLVEKSSLVDGQLSTTQYLYDDLGRLIKTIDNQQHTQTFDYDDAHQRILKTDANGLQTLSIYDKSGLLLSTQRLDATHEYGTTTYGYDATGRLVSETDVTGKTRHLFYDAQGRLQATVSGSGHAIEYVYDEQGHCIQTHEYQQTINAHDASDFATIRPATNPHDRISQVIYNEYNQIARLIDAEGAVIAFQYDAQSRLTSKTAYAHRLTSDMALISGSDDRTITYYYDANGRLQGEINGEGAATSYCYDAQGNLTEKIRYKKIITGQRTGDWATDAPFTPKSSAIHTYSLYNAAGLKIADIDGEEYLTEYVYDARGLRIETIEYYTELDYPITINETTTLDTLRPRAHKNDHHTTYRYNDLNQRIEETTTSGLVITYSYNAAGLVIRDTRTDRQTHEARSQHYRYDALGQVIQSLDALGSALLAQNNTLNQDEIETIWQQHSVRYSYDKAGHLVSQTNALNESTRYVYNDAGLLTYTLSPMGAVTETRYNAFQQVDTTIHYCTYCSNNATANLQGIKQYLSLVANPKLDEQTHYEYNSLGLLISQRKGSGSTQITTYNAFGELSQTAQHSGVTPDILTDYQYDRRGLLRLRTDDMNGINKTVEMQYDAFGWVEKSWDSRQGVTTYMLNNRGEAIRIEDQGHGINDTRYDAFGRVLYVYGRAWNTYTYNDQNHTLTLERMVDAAGATVVTQFNAFGDKLTVTDGKHQTTSYQYNALGQLIHIDAPEHSTADYTYDAAGRLLFQHDAGGHVLRFTYDAEGHVLTKTLDPDGLNITTTYTYDAIGRQLQVNNAGCCTQFTYDNQGNLIQTCQDPDGLKLITTFDYNDLSQLIRETHRNPQGVDQVKTYTRDALGRCLTSTIDPDGLQLTTTYTYDNNDNVMTTTDANQNTTHFTYDPNNRIHYRIDANGIVTEHRYDHHDNETQTITYANKIALAPCYDDVTLTAMITLDANADHYQFFMFDTQNRLMRSYDGLGYATSYFYDANDNLVTKTSYATPCSLTELKKGRKPEPVNTIQSRTTRFAYDGLNHERFKMDPNGRITESRYDAAGQLIQQTRFVNVLSVAEMGNTFLVDKIQVNLKRDPEHDQHTHYTYDQAGRLSLQATAAGVITAYEYDAAGNQTASHQFAMRLTALQLNDEHWPGLIQNTPEDRITRAVYDAAGRAIYRISPTGHVVERRYDAVGNVLTELTHAERWTSLTDDNAHLTQFKYDAAGRLLSQTDAAQHTTRYTYDKNNNVASKTDANHAEWTYVYNAANQLIETRAPVTTFNTYTNGAWHEERRSVITQHEYDNFGNVISDIRDAGGINQTVQYTYDANNRKSQTLYPNTPLNNAKQRASNDRQDITQTLTETDVYNGFGERIEHRDRAGFSRHFVYNIFGQLSYAVDAEGGVTRYQYDAFGNVSTKTTFATRANISDYSEDGLFNATQKDKHDRHEYYVYDQDQRLIESRKDPIRSYNPRTATYNTLSPTTRLTYNAFGDVITQAVKLTDVDWAITTHIYDNDGLKTALIDAENYLTTYHYNAFGLLDEEIQFSTRGTTPTPSLKDRHLTFVYDIQGQMIEKTLKQVSFQRPTGNGSQFETLTCDLTSRYGYDAMGHLISTTDATGHTAFSYYNTQGQLTAKVGVLTQAGRATTTYGYDALGQLVENQRWANGAKSADETQFTLNNASPEDVIQHDIFDANGHVTQKIDGTGHVTQYSYDANGNIARSWQVLNQGLISDKRYAYDRENHLIQTATLNATGVRATDDAQYNAFGEVIKKGLDGVFATQVDYDSAGRVWRSNTQGYFQVYVYDLDDHVTQVLISSNASECGEQGVDLSGNFYEQAINFNMDVSRYQLQRHDNTYDALGRLVRQSQDSHMNNGGKDDQINLPRPTQTQTLDRWGNILLHTNASNHTTRYEYNALNALTEQILPEVTAVDEHGVAQTLAPVNHYAVDILGHTLAMTDANGHTITHLFDAEGRITQDTDARGNHRDKTYNLLGQMTTQTNERGGLTRYTYDAENRLLSVITAQTALRYEYDGAGQVTRQTDASGNAQTMNYDELGHLIQKTAKNIATRYEYDSAGRKTAEHDANGNTSTWRYDEHGRLQEHTDLGGHRTNYIYNTNGVLLNETSSSGKDLVYYYYSDGQMRSYWDKTRNEVINYTYNAEGSVASKITSRPNGWDVETDHYEYDALSRLAHVKRLRQVGTGPDIPKPDLTMLSIDYEYDAVGNIRDTQLMVNYTGFDPTRHTDYFRYDENNRMTINKGQLINGQIAISKSQGTTLAYDESGNIADAQTYESGALQHYTYRYNTDNLLEITRKNNRDFQTKRYSEGLLREETLFNDNGIATQYNTVFYDNGRLTSQTTKDGNKNVASETRYDYDNVGNIKTLTSKNPAGYIQTHQYGYELWDNYLQKTDSLSLAATGVATRYGTSTHTYDANGLLQEVENSQIPNSRTYYFASNIDGIRARQNYTDGQTSYLTVAGKTIGDLRMDFSHKQHLTVYGGASLPETQQDNLGAYTLNAGDTLESIALHVYGDSSLWYLIADANGITDRAAKAGEKGSQLHAGLRLNIPQITKGQHNTSQTHNVLSSTDWTGSTSAVLAPQSGTPPAPPPRKHNNFWKTIAVIVTASVAMVLSAGALAILAGAAASVTGLGSLITLGLNALSGASTLGLTSTLTVSFAAGFTSSIAGQTAANLLHLQNGIDIKSALITGLGTAATAGVSHMLNNSAAYKNIRDAMQNASPKAFSLTNATEMMERDAVSQGLNLALTRHQHFDWLELGVSTATAGIMGSSKAQDWSEKLKEKIGRATAFATSELQALGTGVATGHFDAVQILQDNLGSSISASLLQPEQSTIPQETEENAYCPIPTEEENQSPIPEGTWERFHREDALRRHMEQMTAKYMNEIGKDEESTFNPGTAFGLVGDVAYGGRDVLPVGQGALAMDTLGQSAPDFGGNYQKVVGLSAKEIWDIRAYQGTPIPNQPRGDVDAVENLVGFDRRAWGRLSGEKISSNLDRLQEYVLDAHDKYPNVPVNLINSVIAHESRGSWNAVSQTGALGVMQLTSDNYLKGNGANFNPFNTQKSIMYGTKMLSSYLDKFGSTQNGINKTLAAYNQGENHVKKAIFQYGSNWIKYIHSDGRDYINEINKVRSNGLHMPGYFGEKK